MAVIVQATKTGKRYVFLGTGFGAYKATRPHALLGDSSGAEHSKKRQRNEPEE